MLNKHGILLTENFGRPLDYQISYIAIANIWGRSAVAYGWTCSQGLLEDISSDFVLLWHTKKTIHSLRGYICLLYTSDAADE